MLMFIKRIRISLIPDCWFPIPDSSGSALIHKPAEAGEWLPKLRDESAPLPGEDGDDEPEEERVHLIQTEKTWLEENLKRHRNGQIDCTVGAARDLLKLGHRDLTIRLKVKNPRTVRKHLLACQLRAESSNKRKRNAKDTE